MPAPLCTVALPHRMPPPAHAAHALASTPPRSPRPWPATSQSAQLSCSSRPDAARHALPSRQAPSALAKLPPSPSPPSPHLHALSLPLSAGELLDPRCPPGVSTPDAATATALMDDPTFGLHQGAAQQHWAGTFCRVMWGAIWIGGAVRVGGCKAALPPKSQPHAGGPKTRPPVVSSFLQLPWRGRTQAATVDLCGWGCRTGSGSAVGPRRWSHASCRRLGQLPGHCHGGRSTLCRS